MTQLQWLNKVNGADIICQGYHKKIMDEFPNEKLYGAILGCAYGGEVEYLATLWKNRGEVYGLDVFDSLHPKHLSEVKDAFEATCMDYWYGLPEYGTDHMRYDYQREVLDSLGLDNAILIKGEVHRDSLKDVPKLHYAFLDMDIRKSMENGYQAVRDKIVEGGYLLIHDTQNIGSLTAWRDEEVLGKDIGLWEKIEQHDGQLLVVLKRKPTVLHVQV